MRADCANPRRKEGMKDRRKEGGMEGRREGRKDGRREGRNDRKAKEGGKEGCMWSVGNDMRC